MKVTNKTDIKKDKVNKNGAVRKTKPKKEQILVVAQEIKYARLLSSNEKKTRDRVLKALKKWLTNCFEKKYEFKEEDFLRVWKGLFYAVWMSDKPLIQEQLCEDISSILDLFPPAQFNNALLMVKAGFKTLATEWFGIDQHRMDKFLMLVRRYLRGSLRCLKRSEWSLESCQKYAAMLSGPDGLLAVQTPHYARNASSMLVHFTDCFLEELSKVSAGALAGASVAALLRPLAGCMRGAAPALAAAARRAFTALLRCSRAGLHYGERLAAWKQMGCPEGGPDALEPVSDDDDEQTEGPDGDGEEENDDETPLDPRAGRVNVLLSPLPVPAAMIAALLREVKAQASSRAYTRLNVAIQRFEALAKGQYPLREQIPSSPLRVKSSTKRVARELHSLDHKLKIDADELKLRGLSRKHRKRLLRKSRSGLSIVDDVAHITHKSNSGEWIVETADPKEKGSNKENQHKKTGKRNNKRTNAETQDVDSKKRKLDHKDSLAQNLSKSDKNKLKSKKDEIKYDTVKSTVKAKDSKVNKHTKDSKPDKSSKFINNKTNKIKESDEITPTNKSQKVNVKESTLKVNKTNEKPKNDKPKKVAVETKSDISKNLDKTKAVEKPKFVANKVRKFQKQLQNKKDANEAKQAVFDTPKRVKFALKNNSMQKPVDYYKSVRQSPNIPFDSSKKPTKTNLKPSTPSPINPFFKKKLRMKN